MKHQEGKKSILSSMSRTANCVLSFVLLISIYFLMYMSAPVFTRIYHPLKSSLKKENITNNTETSLPLLTIFTTFKETPDRIFIQNNTIVNWATLGNNIRPLFFGNLTEPRSVLLKFALENGWIGEVTQRTNSFGTPFLKEMYRKVTSISTSHFYGFCNADILFDHGLNKTLSCILSDKSIVSESILVIGRRTNVPVKNITDLLAQHNASLLAGIAKKRGRLFRADAEDYFFMSKPGRFPWHVIKDVVIGRPAYDNYLVGQALKYNVTVIDATRTLLAFHQTGEDGIHAGAKNKDGLYNKRIIGRYSYNSGLTISAHLFTRFDEKGHVVISKRH